MKKPTKVTGGEWNVREEKIGKLPPLHVMAHHEGENLYLASVHETHERGEAEANALIFAAAKDMYQAICVGLTGMDHLGNAIEKKDAVAMLVAAKEKAEGKKR